MKERVINFQVCMTHVMKDVINCRYVAFLKLTVYANMRFGFNTCVGSCLSFFFAFIFLYLK